MPELVTGEQPIRITRAGALRAAIDGGVAFRSGLDPDACPFSSTGEIVERFLRHHWLRAWWIATTAARSEDDR